jgi:RNA polymerase sigma factor (TIGR02999 family)
MPDQPEGTAARPAPDKDRESRAFNEVFSLAYEELRRIARSVRRDDGSLTLTPTALVNEAWMKLKDSPHLAQVSPRHFQAIVAKAMRQILIDAARRRNAQKRGAGEVISLTPIDSIATDVGFSDVELLSLNAAITELEAINPRQVEVIDCISFAGLSVSETAAMLGVSESVVERDWRAAKAWLKSRMQSQKGATPGG